MVTVTPFKFEGIRYFKFGYSPIGKPSMFVYIYFVDGLLIDTGQRRVKKEAVATLSHLEVDQMFITHHHEDHTGNIAPLQRQFDCPVYAPTLCCELMKGPPPLSIAQKVVWGSRPAYADLIPITDQLKTANHNFLMIPIPGHAEDMVALFEPDKGWLFSADLYINSYIGYYLKNESITQQIQSLKRTLELDFRVLFCAHSPQLHHAKEKLEDKLQFLEDFYGQVVHWYLKGYGPKAIFKAMGLSEHGAIHRLSLGQLSKLNMVRSAIRDFQNAKQG